MRRSAFAVCYFVLALAAVPPTNATASTLVFNTADGRVEAGKTVRATITLAAPVPGFIDLTVTCSNSAIARVPPRVAIQRLSSSVSFDVETSAVTSDSAVTITVDTLIPSPKVPPATGRLTILREPQVASVAFEPATVTSGQTAVGTLTLGRAAGFGGVTVPLRSPDSALLRLPATVTVPAGSTSVTFNLTGPAVTQDRVFGVDAPLGGIVRTGILRVELPPLAITRMTLPSQVISDEPAVQGTITFNRPVSGVFSDPIALTADNPALVVTASVLARGGVTSLDVSVAARGVAAGTPPAKVGLTATLGSSSQSATTTVVGRKVTVAGIVVQGGTVTSGQPPKEGQVSLNVPTPAAVTVTLSSSSPNLKFPGSVTIAAGQSVASFQVSGTGLPTGASTVPATLTASLGGGSRFTPVSVFAPLPVLANLNVPTTYLSGGPAQTGQVTLAEASLEGVSVSLTRTFQGLGMPNTIVIPAGQTTGSFTITPTGLPEGAQPMTSTISAGTGLTSKSVTVTVTAPPPAITISSVTFSPPGPLRGGATTAGTVTLAGPAPSSGTTVFLGVAQGRSFTIVTPLSVSIPAGATTGTFQVQTSTNFLSDSSGTPMEAGLGCISARIGAQQSVRGCISVGK